MRNYLLFLALISAQLAFSQDSYFKSSVVTWQNDTINGLISNIFDSKTFQFKKKIGDKPIIYTPKQLKAVVMDGNVFETKSVNLPYYKNESSSLGIAGSSSHLEEDVQHGRLIDTVFVQKLVNGSVSLYKFKSKKGFTYYLAEKDNVLKELPPRTSFTSNDSSYMNMVQDRLRSNNVTAVTNMVTYTIIKDNYLDTLGVMLNDRRFITNPSSVYSYSEKSLKGYISRYNKNKGIENGGILKSKINRKIFTGISAGLVSLKYDEDIEKADLAGSYSFKLYGLYPLMGIDRNLFARFGLNYFTYRNDYYKKSIPSASFGLRYGTVAGIVRPYIEGSIALASFNKNNRPLDWGFPLIIEGGVNVPVKNYFLTLSASYTPVFVYELNGYKLWAFNIGVMF